MLHGYATRATWWQPRVLPAWSRVRGIPVRDVRGFSRRQGSGYGMGQGDVVITHPGRQHSYETVLAAQRAGLLQSFITGLYFTGRGITSEHLLRIAPLAISRRVRSSAKRR